ncbi:1,2-phenylacetyl-CoA epoxidase subunit PaaE [Marinoscillum sp.]|uniref:1,2-phenylacetyl-CoA epoxidase subunit PaaE n=1 Tax=Marinoscillum sp. TaxID=2024838 RepID=UPI003BACBFE3
MQFYPIKVRQLDRSTQDCTIVTLDVTPELHDQFQYKQGQYLNLKTHINGEEVRRSYSLCSSPLDSEWKIGVKKVHDGKFSTYVHDELQEGDELEVAVPDGRFFVECTDTEQRNYVAFAAGSGITPILSIIKTHLTKEANSTFKLFYVNQSVSTIMLKEELEALKNRFMDRLEIYHFLTQEQRDVELFNGRLSEKKLEIIFKTICELDSLDHFFICGPEPMIFMIRDFLEAKGVVKKQIHFELFGTSGKSVKKKVPKAFDGKVSDVTVLEGGKSINFKTPQGVNSILDEALKNNADLPFACKGGVCCTCKAKLVEGQVDMQVNYGLEDDEIENGYILTCQSLPISDKVVVDFDEKG